MKFLPLKYRETQSDWFGKRGISWHISVVARKKGGKLRTQAFVHIVENCNQDGHVVVLIIEHVLQTLKNEHPELSNAYLRQDNAACYHSTVMLETCSYMARKTGIAVRRVDFSDPQGGKGACDRKAATIKAHVRRYVNEGHDVETASQFKEAMLSSGGVHGVRVAVVDAVVCEKSDEPEVRWDGVSSLNNFQYSNDQITVWRAYNVGKGKVVKRKAQAQDYLKTTFDSHFSPGDFKDVWQKKQPTDHQKPDEQQSDLQEEATTLEQSDLQEEATLEIPSQFLFSCPNEGCVKSYQRHSNLEKHLELGKCQLQLEKETLFDKAKTLYRGKLLEGGCASVAIQAEVISQEGKTPLREGWALSSSKKGNRFSDTQKRYLEDKFMLGQETGHKQDPAVVAHDMRFARNNEGARLFSVKEFLTARQIQSYFSRRAAKLRRQEQSTEETARETNDDDIAAAEEQTYQDIRTQVLNEVQLRHSIVFDTYNLCKMFKESKLNKLSISMLRDVCDHFDINMEGTSSRRKAPYIAKITELIETCDCN